MTDYLVRLSQHSPGALASGWVPADEVAVTGSISCRPFAPDINAARVHAEGPDRIILPEPFSVRLVNGECTLPLRPTEAWWCWEVREQTKGGRIRHLSVVDSVTVLDYADAVDVDPVTLAATAVAPAAWWAALQAADLGVQASPDPDDPDVLILTMNSWQLDPTDTLSVVLPIDDADQSITPPASHSLLTGVSLDHFPRLTGETDDMPRFRRAIANGGRVHVPNNGTPYVFAFVPGSTINAPTRVEVRVDGTQIIGVGSPEIQMTGLTLAYLHSINDYASSGRDLFTAFSIIGADGCSVEGIRFTGEYAGGETFRYQSPRSIAVAFKGASRGRVSNVTGTGIFGNVVNVVSASQTYEQVDFAFSSEIRITDSTADTCLENGFNFMGGTRDCQASGLHATGCANGLESACDRFTLSDCIFVANKTGLAIGGNHVSVSNCVAVNSTNVDGAGYYISAGTDITISGGTVCDNAGWGVYLFPALTGLTMSGTAIRRNALNAPYKFEVYAVGQVANPISSVRLSGLHIEAAGSVQCFNINEAYDFHMEAIGSVASAPTTTGVIGAQATGSLRGLWNKPANGTFPAWP